MVSMNSRGDGHELERAEGSVADASKSVSIGQSSHAYSPIQCIMYSFWVLTPWRIIASMTAFQLKNSALSITQSAL